MQTEKGSGESAYLHGTPEPSFLTLQRIPVLAHLNYSLLPVKIYLDLFQISQGLIGCKFISMIMFPCGMLGTNFNIKQNYTVKISPIDRNISN